MKLAIVLTNYSSNKLKYTSAGAILAELFTRNLKCKIYIIIKEDNPTSSILGLKVRKNLLLKFVKFRELSFRRIYEEKNVTEKKIFSSYTKLQGESKVNYYKYTINKYIKDYPGRIITTHDFQSKSFLQKLNLLQLDIGIARGGGILKQNFIEKFRLGILNLHGSGALPYYRGIGGVEFALIDGQKIYTNIHYIDSGIDTGRILLQNTLILNGRETLADIYAKICAQGVLSLVDTIESIMFNGLNGELQNDENGRQHFLPHPFFEKLALSQINKSLI